MGQQKNRFSRYSGLARDPRASRAPWAAPSLFGLLLLSLSLPALSAATVSVSPSAEVAEFHQLRVSFSEPVVPAGDPRLPAPVSLSCGGKALKLDEGRWNNAREWVWRAGSPGSVVGPEQSCEVHVLDSFKAVGGALSGPQTVSFRTGPVRLQQVQPWPGSEIEEDQHFLLRFNGAISETQLRQRAWCEVEGLGERIPVQAVQGEALAAVLKSRGRSQAAARLPGSHWLLHCQRPLPQATKMRLLWSNSDAGPQAAAKRRADETHAYQVRRPFTAEFSCERERANVPCMPVRPMRVLFSAPVSREQALQLTLKSASGQLLKPLKPKGEESAELSMLEFPFPLAENAAFSLQMPAGLKDMTGRPLANAASFPLQVATGASPPLAKFAAAPFGVIEREPGGKEPALLPITMRHVQSDWGGGGAAQAPGEIRVKRLSSPAEVLAWYARVSRYHESQLSAREAGLPEGQWYETLQETDGRGQPVARKQMRHIASRELALLDKDPQAQTLKLPPPPTPPQGAEPRPFEVIGLPLNEPGYHVVELRSPRLGQALLDKTAPMFVRTGVLVTNLGVHFKWSRENSLVWVTRLDRGQPVEGAEVVVHDCAGKPLWSGRTDAQGRALVQQALQPPGWDDKRCVAERGFFVTAQKADAAGAAPDMAFVFSNWNRGIEPWRFNLPTIYGAGSPEVRVHTVLDRSLLRAGETVSMKHFFRLETRQGLKLAGPEQLPTKLKLTHLGSGSEVELPISWPSPRSASSQWVIPAGAKLGSYSIELLRESRGAGDGEARSWMAGSFHVEEFRVPLISATLSAPKAVQVAPKELRLGAQLNYQAGGPMAQAPLRFSALLRPRSLHFAGYEEFSFEPPRGLGEAERFQDEGEGEEGASPARDTRLVLDKQPAVTDRQGAAEAVIKNLPALSRPSELLAELSYSDPNGEVRSVNQTVALWPSKLVLGLRTRSWSNNRGSLAFSALALDTAGKPVAGQRLEVKAQLRQTLSSRKRMVGGFYAYDNRTELKDLGTVCSGSSDAQGLLACEAKLEVSGEVELVLSAKDSEGRPSQAAASAWMSQEGELWFAQDNDDRIDVLAEKKRYVPGETARFQVRMPFREATALVAIEREGVIDTRVVKLTGRDPSFELKIERAWAPNVYVSVLALRGRIQHVPWYSFFSWGWRAPRDWWAAWRESRNMPAPTAMVDLAKPSYKLGVAAVQVGLAEHQLQVKVSPERSQYGVRETVRTRVQVTQDGRPVPGAELAFAAVDEGLLALRGNSSWELLPAMIQQRSWGVDTATAQSEIIGRRHYGRKAVAAGGGGGRAPTRELFDTLLLWRSTVKLDARGEALIEVPLNDSLTSFRLVAVADAGSHQFGTGQATVRVTQDLQVLSGLPPLVREGDEFQANLTLRNSSARVMNLRAELQVQPQVAAGAAALPVTTLPAQTLKLAAGEARELSWSFKVPEGSSGLQWQATASEQGSASGGQAPARDQLRVSQRVLPAVPVQVWQASLSQLDGRLSLPVAPPAGAWPETGAKRGGVNLVLQRRLGGDLPGPRRFFETYPYSCLEQQTSKALGLHDAALWQSVLAAMPSYLDSDGLAHYFPPRPDEASRGSERLTAYLLAASHEAGRDIPPALREKLLQGLTAYIDGRISRSSWSPRGAEIDADVRRLAVLEALSRYGRATPAGLSTVNAKALASWPTAAVIDWLNIHKRMAQAPQRAQRLAEAQALLRSRVLYQGTVLRFSTEESDAWWWLMDNADANASRLMLAVLDEAGWAEELPRLLQGSLGRQTRGAWSSTTANLWGVLALDKFAARFESVKPGGKTEATLSPAPLQALDWSRQPEGGSLLLPWNSGNLNVEHKGAGKPWLTVQSLAAVPLKQAASAGYRLQRTVQAVEQKVAGRWSRGDVLRVRLELEAGSDMAWVVLADPLPGGAAVLGAERVAELSRNAKPGDEARVPPTFEERSHEAWRAYFERLPRGKHVLEYTVRLNNVGRFQMPGTRVEAMYAPENFAELPQASLEVAP
ncbi:alpha-2-macroglobulin [Paucibacter aquatile]|uniref:Alpha-2-macroglobulin n=1 Tax=Kinneretia aquatilis TaxID=2070761 RepID=A0A2N8L3Q9_9BURK|nr:alpha-2-macroglobulin [Paucibacter aquatile]